MNGIEWLTPASSGRQIDTSWLSPRAFDVHPMFTVEPPVSDEPPPPAKAPEPPPPPPGPSPEDLRRIAEAETVLRQLAGAMETLEEATRREVNKIAEEIWEIAMAVAEELAAGAIEAEPSRILDIIRESMEMLGADQPIKVLLNPTVYDALKKRELLDKIKARGGLTLIPEPKLTEAGCIVESPTGRIDARVQSRLKQLRRMFQQKMGGES